MLWAGNRYLIIATALVRAFIRLRIVGMADRASVDHAGVALQHNGLDVVVRLDGGINGVLAAVTGLAVNSPMAGGEAV